MLEQATTKKYTIASHILYDSPEFKPDYFASLLTSKFEPLKFQAEVENPGWSISGTHHFSFKYTPRDGSGCWTVEAIFELTQILVTKSHEFNISIALPLDLTKELDGIQQRFDTHLAYWRRKNVRNQKLTSGVEICISYDYDE